MAVLLVEILEGFLTVEPVDLVAVAAQLALIIRKPLVAVTVDLVVVAVPLYTVAVLVLLAPDETVTP